MMFHLFGWGDPVQVFIAYKADGSVLCPFSTQAKAEEVSELPVQAFWVDDPEAGPTVFEREAAAPVRAERAPE
jgi:hypothetical protein